MPADIVYLYAEQMPEPMRKKGGGDPEFAQRIRSATSKAGSQQCLGD